MVIICQALLADKADLSERWKLSLECHQSVPQQTCHMSLGRHQSVLSRHAECQQEPFVFAGGIDGGQEPGLAYREGRVEEAGPVGRAD